MFKFIYGVRISHTTVVLQAAKRGGADPEKNVELSRALKEAHSVRLPKDNIERALKKASDTSNNEDYKSGTYEIFGHGQFIRLLF